MGSNFRQSRKRLETAKKIAQGLERILKQQDQLITGVKTAAYAAEESQLLLKLAELIENQLKFRRTW